MKGGVTPAGGTRGQQPPANLPLKRLTELQRSRRLSTQSSQMFPSALRQQQGCLLRFPWQRHALNRLAGLGWVSGKVSESEAGNASVFPPGWSCRTKQVFGSERSITFPQTGQRRDGGGGSAAVQTDGWRPGTARMLPERLFMWTSERWALNGACSWRDRIYLPSTLHPSSKALILHFSFKNISGDGAFSPHRGPIKLWSSWWSSFSHSLHHFVDLSWRFRSLVPQSSNFLSLASLRSM